MLRFASRRKGDEKAPRPYNGACGGRYVRLVVFNTLVLLLFLQSGCKSPTKHRSEADQVAYDIVSQKQDEALGYTEGFTITRYSDLLRYRLMEVQGLQISSDASLGSSHLPRIEHWPDPDYLMLRNRPESLSNGEDILDPLSLLKPDEALKITLAQALEIGAKNNFTYQERKESIFEAALDLDLKRHYFHNQYSESVRTGLVNNNSGKRSETTVTNSSSTGFSRNFQNGLSFSAGLVLDITNLLTMGGASSLGLTADASIYVPLLQGSGKHIITEPLTQAERNVVYRIYAFEEYKRQLAVDIADEYLRVLGSLDGIKNAEDNYSRLIISVRRSRRLADAGELREIQVDQAVQNELSARQRWIGAIQSYQGDLDRFKGTLGLPVDAEIELDRSELERLVVAVSSVIVDDDSQEKILVDPNLPAEAPVQFEQPGWKNRGPLEIDTSLAVRLAFDNRLDLRTSQGNVYDSQRAVIIAADKLRTKLDLGWAGGTVGNSGNDGRLNLDSATWNIPLTLDLPLERTSERNSYRSSLITLERSMRALAQMEDSIKSSVRNVLRNMLATRERLQIQAMGLTVAEKRVDSTNLFFEAGQIEIRDVLDAQDSLLAAQNGLTDAVVAYRIAELSLQQQMGLLMVDDKGLWREFTPEGIE